MAIIDETGVALKTEIGAVLSAAGGVVDQDEAETYFTEEAKINHWAKYKPVRYEGDFPERSKYWKAHDGNCGLAPNQLSSYSLIPGEVDGEMNGWEYQLPTGGSTYPYRLGDFRGYDTDAQPMVSSFTVPAQASKQFSSSSFNATAIVAPTGGSGITLADLSLSGCYAGVLVTTSSGSVEKIVIGGTVSGGNFDIEVPCSDLSAGTHVCYPFLATKSSVGSSGQKYYTLPNTQAKSIEIVSSNFVISVLATRRLGGTMAVDYTITISNISTAATWANNAYKLRVFGKEYEDPLDSDYGEMQGSLSSPITVEANTSTTVRGYITGISSKLWSQSVLELWVSFNTGAHIARGTISDNTQT